MMNNDQFLKAKETLIGRLFTLGGTVLYLTGTIIIVIVAYRAYDKIV